MTYQVQIGATTITESVEEKLLGVTLDKNLDFKNYVNTLCRKARQKLHALARVSNYADVEKLRVMIFPNLATVHLFGCFTIGRLIRK